MKKRTAFWWIFVISGIMWGIGMAGMLVGMLLFPNSNLLGGFGSLFFVPGFLGSTVFQITLVIWLIRKVMKWVAARKQKSK